MIEKIQIVCNDFRESFEQMPIESVGRCFVALFRYANDMDYSEILKDDIIARTFFPTLKAHLDRQENYRSARAENGRKGGAPIGNNNARKQTPTDNQKQSNTTKDNLKQPKTSKNKQKQAPNPNPNPYPNPNKRLYGECANVLLTEEEHSKLIEKGYAGLIEELSLYIASKGDKYKSHYATILGWARRREKVVPINKMSTRTDYDFSELEKQLIKN